MQGRTSRYSASWRSRDLIRLTPRAIEGLDKLLSSAFAGWRMAGKKKPAYGVPNKIKKSGQSPDFLLIEENATYNASCVLNVELLPNNEPSASCMPSFCISSCSSSRDRIHISLSSDCSKISCSISSLLAASYFRLFANCSIRITFSVYRTAYITAFLNFSRKRGACSHSDSSCSNEKPPKTSLKCSKRSGLLCTYSAKETSSFGPSNFFICL